MSQPARCRLASSSFLSATHQVPKNSSGNLTVPADAEVATHAMTVANSKRFICSLVVVAAEAQRDRHDACSALFNWPPSLMYSNVNYFVGGGVNRAIVVNTNPTAETVLGLGKIVNKMYGFI